jgi:hypothetical protein
MKITTKILFILIISIDLADFIFLLNFSQKWLIHGQKYRKLEKSRVLNIIEYLQIPDILEICYVYNLLWKYVKNTYQSRHRICILKCALYKDLWHSLIKPYYLRISSVFKGAAPRFLDTEYFSFSVFKTDNVSHFDSKSKIWTFWRQG